MSSGLDLAVWRLRAARALAWALLLGGWVGLGSLAQTRASGPLAAFALLAVWLLALGAGAELLLRRQPSARLLRLLLLGAIVGVAASLHFALPGFGVAGLLPVVLAWAALVALASAAVRCCHGAAHLGAGPPVGAAALGAALAWWAVGDLTDVNTFGQRLAPGVLAAGLLLALLLPRGSAATGACRAGLFDCSLPAWSRGAWRGAQQRPLWLASLVMLPMMCSLPLVVSQCRGESLSPQAVLGLHFVAMFAPALTVFRWPAALASAAPQACAVLLTTGALALLLLPGTSGWWVLALAHGAAWSLAWAAQLQYGAGRPAGQASALAAGALNALLALTLGAAVALTGLRAFAGWHVALGLAAALGAALAARGAVWRGRRAPWLDRAAARR